MIVRTRLRDIGWADYLPLATAEAPFFEVTKKIHNVHGRGTPR
jgi:hypothetical protein